jgi:hypothetical protein
VTATLEPLAAGEVYVVHLEPHPRPRARRVLHAALDLWCATSGGMLELSSAGDVVVRRRCDDAEELRIFAGPPGTAAPMLHQVREDLEGLSPESFRAAWGLDQP